MELLKNIKKGLLQGIGILLMLGIGAVTYSAFTTLSTVSSGETLTADKWNSVINRLNSIDEKQLATARVNFDGTDCTGGDGNDCLINNSYNVSSVDRLSAGKYRINFGEAMDNIYYSVGGSQFYTSLNMHRRGISTYDNTVSSFQVGTGFNAESGNLFEDRSVVTAQVFGGKD